MDKLLTVVVPAYNAENYIRKNLESMVLPKNYMDLMEVLIVDDGGRDHTREIAEEYSCRYPETFSFHHKENGGHGSVINYGIDHAHGKYYKVVDGDDWLNSEELPGFLDLLQEHNEDIIASDYLCEEDETWRILCQKKASGKADHYERSGLISEGFADQVVKMHSLTIQTQILKKMPDRMDEHCFYVDAEYITYPIPYADSIYYDPHNIYVYRLGRKGQSMDIRSMQKNRDQHLRVLASLENFYDRLPNMPIEKKHYIERCIAQIVENQFQIDISRGCQPGVRRELADWDRKLKDKYPGIYYSTDRKSITLLRLTNYLLLPLGRLALRIIKHV